jgi:outer membrane receptor protein involved in Fe transport
MSTSPQSPIDGPGGPGGVIEVLTRDAIGSQLVIARATSDSLPSFGISGTARVALAKHFALRMSASGLAGARDFDVQSGTVPESRHAANGAARLEYRNANDRVALDAFIDDRHYVAPPSETSSILLIDRETTGRGALKADIKRGKLQLQSQLFAQAMKRRSRNFMDAAMSVEQRTEEMSVQRFGGMLLATSPVGKDWRWVASTSLGRDSGEDTIMNRTVSGETSIVEAAADLQYEKKTVRLDGAAGIAAPIGVGADPWPEAKLVARWRPQFGPIEITATGARKGRVPSLRERFDSQMGGASGLGPEKMTHAEVRVIAEQKDLYRVDVAPFFRRTSGQVRFSATENHLVNLDSIDTYGVDVSGRVHPHPLVEVGAAYNFIRLDNCGMDTCTLDRLPETRGEGWVEVTPERRFRINARAKYFGKFVDQAMNLPAYTTLEASATATLSRQYMIVLRGDDLLNARPETHAGYFGPGLVVSVVLQGQWE